MAITVSVVEASVTVAHDEQPPSPTERIDDDGFKATRKLMCAWGDRFTLATQLLGNVVGTGGGNVLITRAAKYPHRSTARVRAVSFEPWFPAQIDAAPSGTKVAEYADALLTVEYAERESDDDDATQLGDEEIARESIEPAAEFITQRHEGLFWNVSDGDPIEAAQAPGQLQALLVWNYERLNLSSIPSAFITLAGHLNSGEISSRTLGQTFKAQTLLYEPGGFKRSFTSSGATKWSAMLRFTYKSADGNGWNYFWNPAAKAYQKIVDGGGAQQEYAPTGDFTSLVFT